MRRGARPCGDGSPGPGRGRGDRRSPDYKSQKPAGVCVSSPPSAPRSLPGPAGRGEKQRGWCPGQRVNTLLHGGENAWRGFFLGEKGIKTRREVGAGGSPHHGRTLPGKIPASPLCPPWRLSGSKGTIRALKSGSGKVRDPPGSAAGTRAGSRLVRETEF